MLQLPQPADPIAPFRRHCRRYGAYSGGASPTIDQRQAQRPRPPGSGPAGSSGARSGRRRGRSRRSPNRSRNGPGEADRKPPSTPLGTTRDSPGSTPKSVASCRASARELGRIAIAEREQLAPPAGKAGDDPPAGPGRQSQELAEQSCGSERPERAGSNQQIGERTTGVPTRPGPAGQLEPLARHAEEVEQPGSLQPVGPGTEERTRPAERLEVPARLDELVLAAAGGLERERGGVEQDRAGGARAPAPRLQPRRGGLGETRDWGRPVGVIRRSPFAAASTIAALS